MHCYEGCFEKLYKILCRFCSCWLKFLFWYVSGTEQMKSKQLISCFNSQYKGPGLQWVIWPTTTVDKTDIPSTFAWHLNDNFWQVCAFPVLTFLDSYMFVFLVDRSEICPLLLTPFPIIKRNVQPPANCNTWIICVNLV